MSEGRDITGSADDKSPTKIEDIRRSPVRLNFEGSEHRAESTDYRRAYQKILAEWSQLSEEKIAILEENSELKSLLNTKNELDSLIKPYARGAFIFMCIYCGVVLLILALHGFKIGEFELPSPVLQYLVGSTAATVIGLVGMVLTGVFVGARRAK